MVGVFVVIGLAQPSDNSGLQQTQNTQSQQEKVQGQTITLPAYQEPIKLKQEQPQKAQVSPPQQGEQPNYYINTAGNKVQSPTKYDSRPSGASARCRDGSYSFSQNRRGTCSHHGGVAEWY